MNSSQNWCLPLPITEAARQIAQQFASEQPNPQKAEQVRLNTLAVWVVNDYLQLMGISTNLTAGDSWNPILRLCADVADLEITGLGRLECRFLRESEQICQIPLETWENRIGYVVVQIDRSLREGTLLGFAPKVTSEELSIACLQPLQALLAHLDRLRQSTSKTLVNLSQWLRGVFENGWETVETLLSSQQLSPAFSFRSSEPGIRRAKSIDLGMILGEITVALVVELKPVTEQLTRICLQIHPTGDRAYLPPNLQLIILDESGAVFLEARSRSADNYIQLQLSGQPGERFIVKVALDEASVTEDFTI
jgi:hypothetical protein